MGHWRRSLHGVSIVLWAAGLICECLQKLALCKNCVWKKSRWALSEGLSLLKLLFVMLFEASLPLLCLEQVGL